MIDKLSLTIYDMPDREYLENNGEITEDPHRSHIYKFNCRLDKATVLYYPHKFSEKTNAKIPFTKIDINPKYFECYNYMRAYINSIFGDTEISSEYFKASRIDIAVDIEDFSTDILLSILRIKRIRSESLHFFKGTVYAGTDPKIRIYDKVKEIKARLKKGNDITEYEKNLLESGKGYTRFEIQIRDTKKTLKEIEDDPLYFASYYDRLEVFNFNADDSSGVLQVLYKYINRKFRNELERYKDHNIIEEIKEKYRDSVNEWFSDKEPF